MVAWVVALSFAALPVCLLVLMRGEMYRAPGLIQNCPQRDRVSGLPVSGSHPLPTQNGVAVPAVTADGCQNGRA